MERSRKRSAKLRVHGQDELTGGCDEKKFSASQLIWTIPFVKRPNDFVSRLKLRCQFS